MEQNKVTDALIVSTNWAALGQHCVTTEKQLIEALLEAKENLQRRVTLFLRRSDNVNARDIELISGAIDDYSKQIKKADSDRKIVTDKLNRMCDRLIAPIRQSENELAEAKATVSVLINKYNAEVRAKEQFERSKRIEADTISSNGILHDKKESSRIKVCIQEIINHYFGLALIEGLDNGKQATAEAQINDIAIRHYSVLPSVYGNELSNIYSNIHLTKEVELLKQQGINTLRSQFSNLSSAISDKQKEIELSMQRTVEMIQSEVKAVTKAEDEAKIDLLYSEMDSSGSLVLSNERYYYEIEDVDKEEVYLDIIKVFVSRYAQFKQYTSVKDIYKLNVLQMSAALIKARANNEIGDCFKLKFTKKVGVKL